MFDVAKIRADFPIFLEYPEMVYFDNAATTHKPKSVIDSQSNFYTKSNSNIHRGIYHLANQASTMYELARDTVQSYINAEFSEEIIFTKGTTESINLVANILGKNLNPAGVGSKFEIVQSFLKPGDEILISEIEHHANLVPWQILATEKNLKLAFIPVLKNGELDLDAYRKMLNPKIKLVAICHVSNTLGTINPIVEIAKLAHQNGSLILIDGAQAVGHFRVDMQVLDVDFYCFSGHKIFSPTGIGVLYAKKTLLEKLPPYQSGGDMIDTVDFENTKFNQLPYKFEAGTPNIAGSIGLAEGVKYFESVAGKELENYEAVLFAKLLDRLKQIPRIRLVGISEEKVAIQSFEIMGVHPQDLAIYLADKDTCIRTGFHCTQPLLEKMGFKNGVCRVSLSFYNTFEEVDKFLFYLKKGVEILS
jgi:cysteine desulfurase/selenocysteine lyase